jgi:hypothetical protein
MDVEKWIEDMDLLMNTAILDKEQTRRKRIIYDEDNIHVEGLDACLMHDEIKLYGLAMDYWVEKYNEFYGTNHQPIKSKKRRFFYWITITGKKRIEVNDDSVFKMHQFGLNIFNNNSYKRYYKVHWNVETGKYIDKSNLHIHALIVFESNNKNFKRDFCNAFKKIFKDYDYNESRFGMIQTEIFKDKLGYLKNENKSVLHKNYKDLKIYEHLEC